MLWVLEYALSRILATPTRSLLVFLYRCAAEKYLLSFFFFFFEVAKNKSNMPNMAVLSTLWWKNCAQRGLCDTWTRLSGESAELVGVCTRPIPFHNYVRNTRAPPASIQVIKAPFWSTAVFDVENLSFAPQCYDPHLAGRTRTEVRSSCHLD